MKKAVLFFVTDLMNDQTNLYDRTPKKNTKYTKKAEKNGFLYKK